jgi:hypothetical protein
LLASVALAGLGSSASAYTLNDNYYGGLNTYNNADIIGPANVFDIQGANVSRSGTGAGSTLTVNMYTNYAGVPGTSAADGTGYGSLFFNTVPVSGKYWNPTGTAPYPTDVYQAGEWNYAFVMNGNGTSGTGTLYAIPKTQTAQDYSPNHIDSGVVASYATSNGNVVLSNVNGDPITYPYPGHPGFYFRQGQAVLFTDGVASSATGTWTVDALTGLISFVIADGDLLGSDFALSWAMTCANDVIQGQVDLPPIGHGGTTPVPAALPLFAGGLGLIGWLGRRRRRQDSFRNL